MRLCDFDPAFLNVPGGMTDLRRLPTLRRSYPQLWGRVLLLCTKTQIRLLLAIWKDQFSSTEVLRKVIVEIVKEGTYVPDMLDADSQFARSKLDERYVTLL